MRCVSCGALDTRVVDSRLAREGRVIRRRRVCQVCQKRFTTYEQIEEQLPVVVKRDGRREPFQRKKVLEALRRACVKRPHSEEVLGGLVERVVQQLMSEGHNEIRSEAVGRHVMAELRDLDQVSFIRFVSVYQEFAGAEDFIVLIRSLGDVGAFE